MLIIHTYTHNNHMKKNSILCAVILFVLFTLWPHPVWAIGEPQVSTAAATIQYDLAYPGILPNHPLYKLKVLRDKISLLFITDPKKKIEFYLLRADKGILATAILVDFGQEELAAQTALKAEHNMTIITELLSQVPYDQLDELFTKLLTASKKHQEVLTSLVLRVQPQTRQTFETVREFSVRNAQTIEDYVISAAQSL